MSKEPEHPNFSWTELAIVFAVVFLIFITVSPFRLLKRKWARITKSAKSVAK